MTQSPDDEVFETGALQDEAATEEDVLVGLPEDAEDDDKGEG